MLLMVGYCTQDNLIVNIGNDLLNTAKGVNRYDTSFTLAAVENPEENVEDTFVQFKTTVDPSSFELYRLSQILMKLNLLPTVTISGVDVMYLSEGVILQERRLYEIDPKSLTPTKYKTIFSIKDEDAQ